MEAITVSAIVGTVVVGGLLCCYLDARYQWRLTDWFNGRCSNPFVVSEQVALKQQLASKEATIEALSERIATLEAIVTEPAYELNQKINALK